jgi:hypothetical protein
MFAHKSPPCLRHDFDAIGFNADALVKYNVYSLTVLVTTVFISELSQEYG